MPWIGDDLKADIAAAQRVGLRGILVLSGKTVRDDVRRAAGTGRVLRGPDGIAPTLADVVAATGATTAAAMTAATEHSLTLHHRGNGGRGGTVLFLIRFEPPVLSVHRGW